MRMGIGHFFRTLFFVYLFAMVGQSASAEETGYPIIDKSQPGVSRPDTYVPLAKAMQPWRLCVLLPRLEDQYVQSVNYGLVEEARRLGIRMQIFEAGGYDSLQAQRKQMVDCANDGAQATIVSPLVHDGLSDILEDMKVRNIPVLTLLGDTSLGPVAARITAPAYEGAYQLAQYLVKRHLGEKRSIRVAWFPGPQLASWAVAADKGFREGLKDSNLSIEMSEFGNFNLSTPTQLIGDVLGNDEGFEYVVGQGINTRAVATMLRQRYLEYRTRIAAYYVNEDIIKGIFRGTVLAAPYHGEMILGRIAVNQAVRLLEKQKIRGCPR